MQTTYRRLSKRQRDELRGYVAPGPTIFRAVLFVAAVALVTWILRAIHLRFLRAALDSHAVWIVPSLAFAVGLYRYGGRWTGGRGFRTAIRRDLAREEVAVHRITAVDAVEVEEGEDEGPAYFVLTDDGTVLLFAGQYLDTYRRKGFPWRVFDIVETPEAKIFMRIESAGDTLIPSVRRPAFTWDEFKAFARGKREYAVVDVDFAALKAGRLTTRAG